MGRSQLPGSLEEREPRFADGRITALSSLCRANACLVSKVRDTTSRQLSRVHPDDLPFLLPFPRTKFRSV
jgi:hypothetical protein